MFPEITLAAKVDTVALDVKSVDGMTIRKCVIKFAREYDDEIATALGGDAKKALLSLRSHGMEKVYIAIDRLDAQAELVSALDAVKIGALRGRQAVCTASKSSEDAPTIRLECECIYSDEAWAFLGRNGGGIVQVTFRPRQQEISATGRGVAA